VERLSDNSHDIIPAENNPEKLPAKIRHTEDDRRITHENTAEQSRLEHQEDADEENVLQHTETTNNNGLVHEETDGKNRSIDGKLAKILAAAENILPDDRDGIGSQAVKHDIFEVPIAILGTMDEVNRMRNKGQRLFFENKDKDAEPVTNGNTASVNTAADAVIEEPDDNLQTDPVLALPEPMLSLPAGETVSEAVTDSQVSVETAEIPKSDNADKSVVVTEKRDYYETLGIGKDADESDIKNAYRSLAKQYHPDVNNGDKTAEAKFKEINEAY
jgi:hypothetical protein